MSQQSLITQDQFDKTLAWLDSDREAAAQKYEAIRKSLIMILAWRGCHDAEDLADDTLNRVMLKIDDVAPSYVGEPALYFYGVARNVLVEYQRRQKLRGPLPEIGIDETKLKEQLERREIIYECLSRCLLKLSPNDGELIIEYYRGDKHVKIDNRRGLAGRVGIAANTLRVKVHRIRAKLEECIKRCMKQDPDGNVLGPASLSSKELGRR